MLENIKEEDESNFPINLHPACILQILLAIKTYFIHLPFNDVELLEMVFYPNKILHNCPTVW